MRPWCWKPIDGIFGLTAKAKALERSNSNKFNCLSSVVLGQISKVGLWSSNSRSASGSSSSIDLQVMPGFNRKASLLGSRASHLPYACHMSLETLPAGPCTNMAHQTTASEFGGDDCKDVQHVVGRRHLSKQFEIHNRPAKIEEDESRSGRYKLILTNFELDISVKNSRKSSCDQIRRALWAA